MKPLSSLLIFLLFLLYACNGNKDFYSVAPELQPYLKTFLEEGQKRGHHFDPKKTGLIMKFAHLSGSQIGLCYHREPLLIEIDSAYWQNISGKKNEEELKINLVFHELGHGLLNRTHDNSVLPSGDWKTIMCGGEKVDSRNWNVNFYGFRQKYYIDELFDPRTPVPDWALEQPDFSTLKSKTVFQDDFFDNDNKWVVGDTNLYKSSIYKGEYKFQTKTGRAIMPITNLGIDVRDDFLYEAKIKMIKTDFPEAKFGIVFGTKDNANTNYFLIDNKKGFYIGNSGYFGWFAECISEYIKPMLFNTISVRKIKDRLYFYINGKFVYQNEVVDPEGDYFGFQLSGNSLIAIDQVKICLPLEEKEKTSGKVEHLILEDSIVPGKKERQMSIVKDSIDGTSKNNTK